ncbi:MAG: gamma carbonic anhydrase family protein [Deltaproteobacteria bacterium]|nr:gamma carbonic anhydrase family protein [Deltaproteobacteria bacterium]
MSVLSYQNHLPKIAKEVFLAEGSQVIGQVEIGFGASVWFNTVIRGDVHFIKIGDKTNVQDNSVIHVTGGMHPTVIGQEVTIGHRAIVHGCTLKDRCLIGMGSIILDTAEVGEESMIAAGSVVTPGTVIPPRVLAMGSPCKVKRDLTEQEIQFLKASAEHYYQLAGEYLA